jgi:hypothetical protein
VSEPWLKAESSPVPPLQRTCQGAQLPHFDSTLIVLRRDIERGEEK